MKLSTFSQWMGTFILVCIVSLASNAQNIVIINNGNILLSGSIQMMIYNGSNTASGGLTNNGNFSSVGGASLVTLNCQQSGAFIAGTNKSYFQHLTNRVNSASQLTLFADIAIDGDLTLMSGLIELNKHTIDLGSGAGRILNETNTTRITGINGGIVTKVAMLNAPVNANPGNIGIEISSTANLGSTQIIRGHVQQTNITGNGWGGVYRYFDVYPTTGNTTGMNITTTFHYFDAEVVTGFTKSELTIWKSLDVGKSWLLIGDDTKDVNYDWVLKSGIGYLNYRVTLGSKVTTPLPLKIINLSGYRKSNSSYLNWQSDVNDQVQEFQVEKSLDGTNFKMIGSVQARLNAIGNQFYQFIDDSALHSILYYRLKLIDADKKYMYSDIVILKGITDQNTIQAFPNPFTNQLHLKIISHQDNVVRMELLNVEGRTILSKQIHIATGVNNLEVGVELLPAGIYFIRLGDSTFNVLQVSKTN